MAIVVVTGAAGALGRAVCRELQDHAYHVVGIDIGVAPREAGHTFIAGVDLTSPSQIADAFAKACDERGTIAGLVNVAGGFVWQEICGQGFSSWEAMFKINLQTAVLTCQAAAPLMERGAAIVNIGAAAASSRVGAGMASYAASKAGVMALTESLAEELRPRGIRVNAILPTILDTDANRREMPNVDLSTWVSPTDAARVVRFLLSQDSQSITGEGVRLSIAPPKPQ